MASTKEMTTTKRKFTAADIEKDCPDRLQQMGKQIAARLEKIDKQIVQAENHSISVNQLITQAKELCDEGGFNAFRDKFFPNLGQSRVYELLAIGNGKKTVEETRADTRARVTKHRATKAAAGLSVTVTENLEPVALVAPEEDSEIEPRRASGQTPEPSKPLSTVVLAAAANSGAVPEKSEQQDAPIEGGVVEHPSTAVEQTMGPAKPWTARASVEGMRVFTVNTTEVYKATNKRPAEHFSETAVSVEIVEDLGHFYTKLAKVMRADAAKPTLLQGDGTASPRVDRVA